jgi:hypothetical protein
MASEDFIRAMALEQRKRLVAMVMDHFEKQVLPLVPQAQRAATKEAFRAKVMDAVGRYHDYTLDALKAATATSDNVVNEHYLTLLQEIHGAVTRG